MKKWCFTFIVVLLSGMSVIHAQEAVLGENTTIYKTEYKLEAQINSFGWGFGGKIGQYQGSMNRIQLGFDVIILTHPKEIKTFNPYYEDGKGYFFGKMNSVILLKPSIGFEKLLSEKYRKTGVQISYTVQAGPSFAVLKPVYLEIGKPRFPYEYIDVERYNPEVHSIEDIYGRASYINGLSKIKMSYGINASVGLNFEYSNVSDGIRGLSVGVMIDAFSKELPIMALAENKKIFAGFYIALFYGKKYVR
jgi:hypothetical protein